MKKLLLLLFSYLLFAITGVAATPEPQKKESLAQRIAQYPLWLQSDKDKDGMIYLPIPLSGVGRHFAETGLYDVSGYAKWIKISLGVPLCSQCKPRGITASIDVESYINNGPFWFGLRGLGGGFVHHCHVTDAIPEPPFGLIGINRQVKEQFVGMMQSPSMLWGATLSGNWGCWDASFGIKPYDIKINGGVVPTIHSQFFIQSYGYTPPATYGPIRARLFVGIDASATEEGKNREWGVAVWPGTSLRALFGVQACINSFRFGVAYGGIVRGATRHRIADEKSYTHRLKEYRLSTAALAQVKEDMHYDQQQNVWKSQQAFRKGEELSVSIAPPMTKQPERREYRINDVVLPLHLEPALKTGVFSGYMGGIWGNYSYGVSLEVELSGKHSQTAQTTSRLAVGYTF